MKRWKNWRNYTKVFKCCKSNSITKHVF